MVKGYKVFNHDWACNVRGNVKQYACPGRFEENVQPVVCKSGMHYFDAVIFKQITGIDVEA